MRQANVDTYVNAIFDSYISKITSEYDGGKIVVMRGVQHNLYLRNDIKNPWYTNDEIRSIVAEIVENLQTYTSEKVSYKWISAAVDGSDSVQEPEFTFA